MEKVKSQSEIEIGRDIFGNVKSYRNRKLNSYGEVVNIAGINTVTEVVVDGDTANFSIKPILNDCSSITGKQRDWKGKKISNEALETIYRSLSSCKDDYYSHKADRLHNCATYLNFNIIDDKNHLKLKNMNSCRVKLCPVCGWRRTLKIGSHARRIFEYIENNEPGKYCYMFLTLTVPSVKSDALSDTLTHILKSFARLMDRREIKKLCSGWYRGLEITRDNYEYITPGLFKKKEYYYKKRGLKVGDKNPTFDTYHPHLHVFLLFPRRYLERQDVSRGYLTKQKWLELWRECTRDNSITQVDIDEIKPRKKSYSDTDDILQSSGLINAICETTKYTVKDKDYIITYDFDLSCDVVKTLDNALHHRRLIAWGGLLKEVHKKLNLDDEVDGDLVNVDDDDKNVNSLGEVSFFWHIGYKQYLLCDTVHKSNKKLPAEFMLKKVKKNKTSLDVKSSKDSVDDFKFSVPDEDFQEYMEYVTSKRKEKEPEKQLLLDGLEVFSLEDNQK